MVKKGIVFTVVAIALFGMGNKMIAPSAANSEVIFENNDGVLREEKELFLNTEGNMQGITFGEDEYYVGFDIKNGNGKIRVYDTNGKLKRESESLKIGHSAGLAFNKKDKHIYVANGGGKNPTEVYKVNSKNKMKVVEKIDFSSLGNSGLVAIDNDKNEFVLHTAKNDKEGHIFSRTSLDGKIINQFRLENLGVPQGIEYLNGKIYFYTNNKITVIDEKKKEIINEYKIDKEGESEGITFIKEKRKKLKLAYGYNNKNRIYINECK